MDRDTKIGLVLALAFVGLVGAVLYHKMENPETLQALTPPTLVAQNTSPNPAPLQTPLQEPPPAGETQAKGNAEEPPPPAPPTNPVPTTVTTVENKEGPGRIVINNGPVPSGPTSWWPVKKKDQGVVAKNDTPGSMPEPPPPAPPVAPSRQETPAHLQPSQPNQPVAKKEGGFFHFLHREKKSEPAKPTGLTFDQTPSPLPPSRPPEQPAKDIVLNAPAKQDNGFQPPGPPSNSSEPTPPMMILPEKKQEASLQPTVPGKKTEWPWFSPQGQSEPTITTPPAQSPIPPMNNTPPVERNEQTPPAPPVNNQPPIIKNDPPPPTPPVMMEQPRPVPAAPVQRQPETRSDNPPANRKPLPPSNTFDRRFTPSVSLGKPQEDNKPSANPSQEKTEGSIVGQPVIMREQPDLPPAREGIPVVTRPGAIITKEYPRPQVQVTSMELRNYTPKQGETYATISRLLYGHEKYEAALAQFNKERNPRLASVWPGEPIKYPSDKGYLERKYPNLINATAPRSPLDATGPTSKYMPPSANDIQTAEARVSQPPKNPVLAAGGGAVVPSPNKNGSSGPRYRVRQNDSLYSIALKTLGKGERWHEIYKLNQDVLHDLNQPEVGLFLKLPADAKEVDTAATQE